QFGSQVLRERLVGSGRSPLEDGTGVLGNVFDLHAGHGATLAPMAPMCKLQIFTAGLGLSLRAGGRLPGGGQRAARPPPKRRSPALDEQKKKRETVAR